MANSMFDNPWAKGLGANSNALIGLGAGLLSGRNFAQGLAAGGQGWMQGAQVDGAAMDRAMEDQQQEQSKNMTREWLQQAGYADLVPLVDMGRADEAFNEGMRRMQPAAPQSPIKVGAGETLLDPVTMQPLYQGAPDQKDAFGYEKDLYSQYSASDPVKAYEEVRNGYERVRQSSALQSGAGDMGLIYGYMKMLDPGSVVRETEFAMAAQAGSYGEQIQGWVTRIMNGERLPDSVRREFVQSAEGLYGETASNLESLNQQFTTRAQNYGVNPGLFIRQPEQYQPIGTNWTDAGGGFRIREK